MRAAPLKVAEWMERQATRNESRATSERFESLKAAYLADAKNYRAMAKDIRTALAELEVAE